ncbi:tetratricopeptide repeat protein [Streptomyces collinus]|uniref:tetratricopeptide repeat protein n=1 Tax=Streptomyces collinus TaxID=42684 RepID=UPI00363899CA
MPARWLADGPAVLQGQAALSNSEERLKAARLFQQVAADRAQILGSDHPDSLNARYNHADELGRCGSHDEAARLFQQVADDTTRALGPDQRTQGGLLPPRRRFLPFGADSTPPSPRPRARGRDLGATEPHGPAAGGSPTQ